MKAQQPEIPKITLKFKNIMSFEFETALQKVATASTSNKNACAIHKVFRAMKNQREIIVDKYKKDITEIYAPKDEKGKIKLDEQGYFEPAPEKEEEFKAAQKAFEETEFTVQVRPLTPTILADVRLSGKDIELLGPLFTEDEPQQQGPPLPHIHSV